MWIPLSSPDPEKHDEDDLMDVESPNDLLGKPWTFKIRIVGATGLPIITDLAYCQYEFLGELFTTESVEQNTRSPVFNYEFIHHIDCVTEQFIEYLQSARLEFQVFVNPYILDPPKDKISTKNPAIAAQLGEGHAAKPTYDALEEKCAHLEKSLSNVTEELKFLREQYRAAVGSDPPTRPLEDIPKSPTHSAPCTPRKKIESAKAKDIRLNSPTQEAIVPKE
eukprot:jgi/Phyca11/509876/fgenesh2_kg.PHYCAscaffold_51_\